jgi:hypothetical protein
MLRRVTAVEYVRPMKSGRTSPLLIRCADDDGSLIEVVVKFSAFCDQGEENLAMEVIAACLAGDLALPVSEPLLVVIPDEWIAIVPDKERSQRIRASSRVAFGSKFFTGGYTAWTPDTKIRESMIDAAAGIFSFDAIIQNPDRRSDNPNCLVRGESIRIFDHELAFGHQLVLNWTPPWAKGGLNWLETKGMHIFRRELQRSMMDFDSIKAAWKTITNARLAAYQGAVPVGWGAAAARVTSALELLRDACANIDGCIAEIRRVLS